jgi:hypothetical protein
MTNLEEMGFEICDEEVERPVVMILFVGTEERESTSKSLGRRLDF